MKLHDITGQFKELYEIEDLPPDVVADTLEAITGEFEDKAKSIVAVSTNLSSDVAAIDAEIKRLNDRKQVLLNRDKSLREYLKNNMQASGITNIKCPLFSITLAKGRDIVVIHNETELPDQYMKPKVTISPDKKQILADLKEGIDVPGAHIEKSQESIRIK